MQNTEIQQIADRVIADCFDTATGSPVTRASVLFHSWATDWPEARGVSVKRRSVLIDLVNVEVGRRGCPQNEEGHMASKGENVVFTSLNDGKDHDGTVREVIGDRAVIVDAPDTRRGWEIVEPQNVRSN